MTPTVKFNEFDSYDFFNMIMEDYDISNAAREFKFFKIPGRSGKLDATDYFGEIYEDRDINMIFYSKRNIDETIELQSQLDTLINGKRMRLVFSNDPGHYWDARITKIVTVKIAKNMIKVNIDAVAYPYKYNLITGEEVL